MLTQIFKLVSIALLLLAVLPLGIPNDQVFLTIVVCASSVLAIKQAVRARKYSWAVAFVTAAVLFNPVAPIARTGNDILLLNWIGLAIFLFAAATLKNQPRLSMRWLQV